MLGKYEKLDPTPKSTDTGALEKKLQLKERFKSLLKDRFKDVSNGNFVSTLPGIESITIIKALPNSETGKVSSLHIIPFYKKGEKLYHKTLSLLEDGTLSGRPKELAELNVTRENLYEDVLHTIEMTNLDFWENVSDEILPPGEWLKERIKRDEERIKVAEGEPKVDPHRIEFMEKQPECLFGIIGANSGFRGYYGYIFPTFFVLENRRVGNAAYFFDFKKPVKIDLNRLKLPPVKRLTKSERQEVLKENWGPVAELTKSDAIKAGAARVIHPDVGDEEWGEKMQLEINKRLGMEVAKS